MDPLLLQGSATGRLCIRKDSAGMNQLLKMEWQETFSLLPVALSD